MCGFIVLSLVFPYQAKRFCWGTSPKWAVFCWTGHRTAQSINLLML